MPSIPRRPNDADEAPAPEDQRTQVSSGDPLAPPAPGPPSAATSGDPLTRVIPPQQEESEAAPSGAIPEEGARPADAQSGAAAQREPTPGDSPNGDADQATVASPPVEAPTTVIPSGDPLTTPQQPTAETAEVRAEDGEQAPADARPRFRQRTRMRRRLRYLRRLRELAFRDLGGLVFDLHRFGRERNDLVTAKLEALANIDRELRTLQERLGDRRDFTDLREAGIAACPRCGTLHDTDANFCPGCGTSLRTAIVRDAAPVTVTPADDASQQQQTQTPS